MKGGGMGRRDGGGRAKMLGGKRKKKGRNKRSDYPLKIKRDLSVFNSDDSEDDGDRQAAGKNLGRNGESGPQERAGKFSKTKADEQTVRSDDKEQAADHTREAEGSQFGGGGGGNDAGDEGKDDAAGRRRNGRRRGGGGGGGGWERFFADENEDESEGGEGVDEEDEPEGRERRRRIRRGSGRDEDKVGDADESDGGGDGDDDQATESCSGDEGESSADDEEGEDSDGVCVGRSSKAAQAFAKAFGSLVGQSGDGPVGAAPEEAAAAVAAAAVPPILVTKKRRVEKEFEKEEEEKKAAVAAKRSKREVLSKGCVLPLKYLDVKERQLVKIATRGVVKLFNAVSQAQKIREEEVNDKDAVKQKKAAFLTELRGSLKTEARTSPSDGGAEDVKGGVKLSLPKAKPGTAGQFSEQQQHEPGRGWAILKNDYMIGKNRLKDWDQMEEYNQEMETETMAFSDGDGSSSGDD